MRFPSPAVLSLLLETTTSTDSLRPTEARKLLHDIEPQLNPILPRQQSTPAAPSMTDSQAAPSISGPSGFTTTAIPSARPRNHNIAVGYNSSTFTPSTLKNIPQGDTLTFYFYPSNYSVIQSGFNTPCQPLDSTSALFSGWNPTSDSSGIARSKFVVTLGTSETIWLYALNGAALVSSADGEKGKSACQVGMALVINPLPKEQANGQTLGNYKRHGAALLTEQETARIWDVPGAGVVGGEARGVSDREKVRWEGKHPYPPPPSSVSMAGVDGSGLVEEGRNGTSNGDGGGSGVNGYTNGAAGADRKGAIDRGGWLGVVAVLGAGVLLLSF